LGIGQGFMAATPMQVAQMGAVVANGGFLYRPSIIHHMSDEDDNIVFVDDGSQIVLRAHPGPDGETVLLDAAGNEISDPTSRVEFDENGNYIFTPEVIDSVAVDREYLEIVAEGMRLVNTRLDEVIFYTGATYVDWTTLGVTSGGKTGTAEYCDNIAISRGWCRFEDIINKRILPTHSWYVGYAPFENPEIVVSVFIFNGGEGSAWAAPIACNVMAAYFGMGQFAPPQIGEEVEATEEACISTTFNYEPEQPELDFN
jgi:penicillin-binding protein 2